MAADVDICDGECSSFSTKLKRWCVHVCDKQCDEGFAEDIERNFMRYSMFETIVDDKVITET